MADRQNYRDRVVGEIIEQIEQGAAPWQKPWKANVAWQSPFNPLTNKAYRGFNAVYLTAKGFADPRWLTFKQAQQLDAKVKKGEKATQVEYWKWQDKQPLLDEDNTPVLDETGAPQFKLVQLSQPRVFYANVFNADQIDGLEPLQQPEKTFEPVEEAERILQQTGVEILHDQSDRAFYAVMEDKIHLPVQEAFNDAYEYYATALHEVGHATGHRERLNRDFGPFGSEQYAKEELRAELASFMLTTELGLGHYPERHAGYVESWAKILKDDRNEIFRAARDAEMAVRWVLKPELRQELQQGEALKQEAAAKVESKPEQTLDQAARHYLTVPYEEREAVKALGAKWDRKQKAWYVPADKNLDDFSKWNKQEAANQPGQDAKGIKQEAGEGVTVANDVSGPAPETTKTFLQVPFKQNQAVKKLGARWDRKQKAWYIPQGFDRQQFSKWLPENQKLNTQSPQDEFAGVLKDHGMELEGKPVFDGKWHRVQIAGDKKGSLNGSYRAFGDNVPNAQYMNFKADSEPCKWVSKGVYNNLSPAEAAALKAEQEAVSKQRSKEIIEKHKATAKRAYGIWMNAKDVDVDSKHPYLQKKGISGAGLKQSDRGQLIIPLKDKRGYLWNLQFINEDGSKFYMRESRNKGVSSLIDPDQKLKNPSVPIIVAEGYATAKTIQEATEYPTVSTTVAGNIEPVVKGLREKHPDRQIIIAADDDQLLTRRDHPLPNKGLEEAKKAANNHQAGCIIPKFSAQEIEAGLSDYNDLYLKYGPDKFRDVVLTQIQDEQISMKAQTDLGKAAPDKSAPDKSSQHRQQQDAIQAAGMGF